MARFLLVLALFLGGCAAAPEAAPYDPPADLPEARNVQAPAVPQRHDWAEARPFAIPSGDVYSHAFALQGGRIEVGYRVSLDDGSSIDAAFILERDLAEYRAGEAVRGWAVTTNSRGATETAALDQGNYAFVVKCRNAFADCDGQYDLWATY